MRLMRIPMLLRMLMLPAAEAEAALKGEGVVRVAAARADVVRAVRVRGVPRAGAEQREHRARRRRGQRGLQR